MRQNETKLSDLPVLDEVLKGRHDLNVTNETIKKLLADGTPDWVSHPEDYKNMAKEYIAGQKEDSDAMVAQYRLENQDVLAHAPSRKINAIGTRDFIEKLRANDVKCFTIQNTPGVPQVGLWAIRKSDGKAIYVAYCQIPAMYEWSVLRLDEHGLGAGEEYRGWRTVLCQLILKGIIDEQKAHKIFGPPSGPASVVYRKTLYSFRNGLMGQPNTVLEL